MPQATLTSDEILRSNSRYIPGGLSSVNRLADPNLVFINGEGSRITDVEGREYIDYHGAFSPQFLGYNHPRVVEAIKQTIDSGANLFGSGPTELEGRLAQLVCENIPWVERLTVFNSGSEATAQAIRLARACTGRDDIIVMQGGYNGWHNDVACNLMTPLEQLGPRVSAGEYPFHPISAGIPAAHRSLIHAVNFNDLESVQFVCEKYPVAAILTEPILQNVGLIMPSPGYLEGLRGLADQFGCLLVFDEIKTGFRHAFGGYAEVAGVVPDLAVYGKAIASGYPLAAIAGPARWMEFFYHPDAGRRVLLAGTYNAHPIPTAAAIATLEVLLENNGAAYDQVERLGATIEDGLGEVFGNLGPATRIVRQGSAFVAYFMDHAPVDWHDLAAHHDFDLDTRFRQAMISNGIYFFPVATKQCSLSLAHTADDVAATIEAADRSLKGLAS